MKVTFLGATHEVTGSCTLIEIGGKHGLVDCGMEQGKDIFENQEIPVNPGVIDFVILTHAHIDHSGNLPLLYKNGFRGQIYSTEATASLCSVMLRDSAHIQMAEAEWRNRKAKRSGGSEYQPIYDMNDAEGAISKFIPCKYGREIQISECVTVRFTDVGHLLGSSCAEIWLTEGESKKKIVFSGDVGNDRQPIIRSPQTVDEADYVVIESTYGDRLHGPRVDYVKYLSECIQRTLDRGGNVVIPSFAVGRTQELLYFIREIKEKGLVHGHENFPVFVDSPLAIESTNIFLKCDPNIFNDETQALLRSGINPLTFPGLKTTVTSEESQMINFDSEPKVIISASGMCEAGRIRHHLKHNLWRPESLILFVGYQTAGTLGRSLLDGAKSVKLFGETVAVNAEITNLPGKSGHADKNGLIAWLGGFKEKPGLVFVNHGESTVVDSFAECLEKEHGYTCYGPYSGTEFDLAKGEFIARPVGIPVEKAVTPEKLKNQAVYGKFISAGEQLLALMRGSNGLPNKDLAAVTVQLEELCRQLQR